MRGLRRNCHLNDLVRKQFSEVGVIGMGSDDLFGRGLTVFD
jgi:hypothetical protein